MKKGGGDEDEDDEGGAASKKDLREAAARAAQVADDAAREAEAANEEGLSAKDLAKRRKEEDRERRRVEREAAEALAREEEEKRKAEEYDKWKDMFSVDEDGEGAGGDADEDVDLLTKFIVFLKERKVTALEDAAAEFGLRAADAVARVQALEGMGHVTGVIDDRGKFIYISNSELDAVAKFVQKKGRVSISALAQESNKLIDLTPRKLEADEAEEGDAEEPTGDAAS